jgi:hypothetical protein
MDAFFTNDSPVSFAPVWFDNAGTSEGVTKSWDTRRAGGMSAPKDPGPQAGEAKAGFHDMLADRHSAKSRESLKQARQLAPGSAERAEAEGDALEHSKRALAHRASAVAYRGKSSDLTHKSAADLHAKAQDYSQVRNKSAAKAHGMWSEQHQEQRQAKSEAKPEARPEPKEAEKPEAPASPAPKVMPPHAAPKVKGAPRASHESHGGHRKPHMGIMGAAAALGGLTALAKTADTEEQEHEGRIKRALHRE